MKARFRVSTTLTVIAVTLLMNASGASALTEPVEGEVRESPWSEPLSFPIPDQPRLDLSTQPTPSISRALELAQGTRDTGIAVLDRHVSLIPGVTVGGAMLTVDSWAASDAAGDFYVFSVRHGSGQLLGSLTPTGENLANGTVWLLKSPTPDASVDVTFQNIPVLITTPQNHENDFAEFVCDQSAGGGGFIYGLAALLICQQNLYCGASAVLVYNSLCGGPFVGRYFGWQNYGFEPPYQADKSYHYPSSTVGDDILLNPDWRAEFPYCDPVHGSDETCWFLNPLTTQWEVRTTEVHGYYVWPDNSRSGFSRTCTCESIPNDGLQQARFYTVPSLGTYLLTVIGNFSFYDSTGHYRIDAGSLRKYHIVGG